MSSMARSILLPLLLALFVTVRAHGSTFGLDLHHRFSDKLRNWAQSMSMDVMDWPQKGTPEYYATLAAHDSALLHRRGLLGSSQNLTFAAGNETYMLSRLGFLHYTEVALGTPNMTFLVALDTGSDLFWLPCDCNKCAPTYNDYYNISFNIFNSTASSTGKRVPCSSNLCQLQSSCSMPTSTCPYKVKYMDNSSSSGVLLEDVMYFITDDARQEAVQARVTFGCGQDQPDTFNSGTPNGLLGLGLEKISVPSTLTAAGLTSNSFSMCFSRDGQGRIRFGDEGSPDQDTTPFYPNISIYAITVTEIRVGSQPIKVGINAYFDTGSSFTLLADPVYTTLTRTFEKLLQRPPVSFGSQLPFEYCYKIGFNETEIEVPSISLTMKGGKEFNVLIQPYSLLMLVNLLDFAWQLSEARKLILLGRNS